MLARLSCHFRQNVVGYLALFVALGGTSYAAANLPKHSVGTKQLKNGAVTHKKLGVRSVSGSNVKNGTLTGTNINASTLGEVPSAANATNAANATSATNATNATTAENSAELGGLPASAYLQPPVGPSQFGTLPAVRTTNSTNETVNPAKVLTFDTNDHDNAGMHSTTTNTARLTAPVSGIYEVTGDVDWAASSGGPDRQLFILKNASETEVASDEIPTNSSSADTVQEITTQVNLNAGDYVVLDATTAAGPLTINADSDYSPMFAMHWVGP